MFTNELSLNELLGFIVLGYQAFPLSTSVLFQMVLFPFLLCLCLSELSLVEKNSTILTEAN